MPQGVKISFVTWPDGRVDDGSLTIAGERTARKLFCASYLPEQWFGRGTVDYVVDSLWNGAREKGFRSHTITIGKDGKPVLEPD